MIRGALLGGMLGAMVLALAASVVSLLTPLPPRPGDVVAMPSPVPQPPVPGEPAAAPPDPAPVPQAPPDPPQVASLPPTATKVPEAVDPAGAPTVATDPALAVATAADAPKVAGVDAETAAAVAPAVPDPGPTPALTTAPAPAEPPATAPPVAGAATLPDTAAGVPDMAQVEPAPSVPGGLMPAPQPAAPPEPEAVPQPEPEPQREPEPAPQPATDRDAAPQPPVAPARPRPGFGNLADGARSDRLPRIGETAAPDAQSPAPSDRALDRNARAFDNPSGKPPFAILLLDDPDTTVDIAALAAGDLALTLVVDPTAPGAADRAAAWRAAGQEVALLTNALPARGRASDYEVALESLLSAFPQTLAMVDAASGGLQGDRAAVVALVPGLAARGLGLVTWDRGLNSADQVARREGLPATTIFRELDAENEAPPVIRRYLDRAAFKAQQDGRAVVIGRMRPETVAALAEWALEGRAAGLALAPVSALLTAR